MRREFVYILACVMGGRYVVKFVNKFILVIICRGEFKYLSEIVVEGRSEVREGGSFILDGLL